MPVKSTSTIEGVNLAILMGIITTPLVSRDLQDGSVVSSFDLATTTYSGRVTVPISVDGEPDVVAVGTEVCVVGHVRRRFFRTGAGTTSRTEVVAHSVVPMRRMAQVRKAVDKGITNLLDIMNG